MIVCFYLNVEYRFILHKKKSMVMNNWKFNQLLIFLWCTSEYTLRIKLYQYIRNNNLDISY